jgi:branched-chain amino acid transport system substrate-binding protein
VKEKLNESYNQGDKDFTALVSKLKLNGIDIVYDGGYHQEAGLIVRQMHDQGLKTILMAGDALADREFASIAGPAAEGVLFTFGPDPRKRATAAPIVEKFKAKGIDPEGYTLYTYAAYQIWAQAAAKAGSVDGQKVAATMHADTWDTVLGPLSFDKKGDITAIGWAVFRWDKDGNYDEITESGRT